MRFYIYTSFVFSFLMISCKEKNIDTPPSTQWKNNYVKLDTSHRALTHGQTHLSVYSSVYSQTEHRTHDLTATVSMRNLSMKDSLYISNADYFNTKGEKIKSYLTKAIGLAPLETVEIVIGQKNTKGGTGGNFVFDWYANSIPPHFEAIMISTSGSQGISFRTEGINILDK